MAIIFENQSKCPLCGKFLSIDEEYILLPPFIGNRKDPLFNFSDQGIHNKCIVGHSLGEEALKYVEKYDDHLKSKRSGIATNGEIITNPGNMLSLGLLTSDATESLFKYNFLIINKDSLNKWVDRDEFLSLVKQFNREGKWEGLAGFNYLDYLINIIEV